MTMYIFLKNYKIIGSKPLKIGAKGRGEEMAITKEWHLGEEWKQGGSDMLRV